jgi:hypothetical protein
MKKLPSQSEIFKKIRKPLPPPTKTIPSKKQYKRNKNAD